MNTSAKALIFAVASVAAAASIGSGLVDRSAAQPEIIKLERVEIVGKRASADLEVVQLQRVLITGRSVGASEVQVAATKLLAKAI